MPRRRPLAALAALGAAAFVTVALGALVAPPAMAQVPAGPAVPDWVSLARELKPSVVYITARGVQGWPAGQAPKRSGLERFFGLKKHPKSPANPDAEVTSLGTGFILTPDGYIGTSNHVIETFTNIHVTLDDGTTFAATVVGRDPRIDLALLKIDTKALKPIPLANSSEVEVGEPVMAIGNPFGLAKTVTVGVVSATSRETGERPWDKYIQTDASINPGNSGGPLINAQGKMIGVNATFFSPSGASIGIGLSIPINLARATLERLAGKPLGPAP